MKTLICVLISVVTVQALAAAVPATDCQQTIGQARGAYYNLKKQGFNGFKATIEPNWEVTLGQTSTPQSLKVFKSVRFLMVADANGAVTVDYEIAEIERARTEAYIKQIHENMQRLVAGFFGTWSRFVVTSIIPENDTTLKTESTGKECRVSFTTDAAYIALVIDNELKISEWKLSSARAKRTLKPVFQKTPGGLLLTGYSSLFEPVDGIKTTLDYSIEYQDVDGLRLPLRLEIRGTYGNEPVAAELRFTQYVLNPRAVSQ